MTIPSSVTSIAYGAFAYCTGLSSVTLPNSVTSIENYAFYKCSNLTDIYSLAETPPTIFSGVFTSYSATLHVPTGCKAAYQVADYWKNFTNIVEEDLSGIKTPVVSHEEENAPYYDLQGRKVEHPSKGIYIHGGKKVLVK